jgi:hypothetical protein
LIFHIILDSFRKSSEGTQILQKGFCQQVLHTHRNDEMGRGEFYGGGKRNPEDGMLKK